MKRVQRPRSGRTPHYAVFVGKGSAFESPFRVVEINDKWSVKTSAEPSYLATILTAICHLEYASKQEALLAANACYKEYLHQNPNLLALVYEKLQGANLACFNKVDEVSHADVLIDLLQNKSL
jgi:hypothetical protein